MVKSKAVTNGKSGVLVSLLKKILQRESILALLAILASFWWVFSYFSHKNHIVATVTRGQAVLDQFGSGVALRMPIEIDIQNIGDGTITLNEIFLSHPIQKNGKLSCDYWATFRSDSVIHKTISVKSDQNKNWTFK